MIKPLLCLFALTLTFPVYAQVPAASQTEIASSNKPMVMAYGQVDIADLQLKQCIFEPDANAEVLFDRAVVIYKFSTVIMERHQRIKIFNDNGKDAANIRIEYYGAHNDEDITNIQAETVNLNDKTIEFTPVEKQLIYNQKVDKDTRAIVFTFPNVKAGSIVELKYKWSTPYGYNYPDWVFQSSIPTRYSEFDASFDYHYPMHFSRRNYQPLAKDTVIKLDINYDTRHIWALANVKGYKSEPKMDYPSDYLQSILFKKYYATRTWKSIGDGMLADEDFGQQLNIPISKQEGITSKYSSFKTNDQIIAYLFDTVKRAMTWNKEDDWYTVDGVKKAWDKKIGNSTEINLILYNLLRACNIRAFLIALRTREHGKLEPDYPSAAVINKTVVYIPVDSAKYYVLDASNPYNTYNNIPFDLIGLNVLSIDPYHKIYGIFSLEAGHTRETTLIDGSITADGKLEGTTQISGSTYSREKYLRKFEELGEKKYIQQIEDSNAGLKITSLKFENVANDTLPLIQNINLKYNLAEPDGDYMYFNPNALTGFETNPFYSEARVSNVDFRCLYNYSISGRFKIPAGYKADVLPKSASMVTGDESILFKRLIGVEQDAIVVHYVIDFKRSLFTRDEYAYLRNFYKKMYELLNEQIVLKKQ